MGADVLMESFAARELEGDAGLFNAEELRYTRYLPSAYRERHCSVLYWLYDERSGTDMRLSELLRELKASLNGTEAFGPIIVAAADVSQFDGTARDEQVSKFITAFENRYNLRVTRGRRFITGHRSGGHLALISALKRPDAFGAVMALNAAAVGRPLSDAVKDLVRTYSRQPLRVPAYRFASEDGQALETVRLYQLLHRKPTGGGVDSADVSFPISPAELRIDCSVPSGHPDRRLFRGFLEGLKYMTGQKENDAFSPLYDDTRYNPELRGSVAMFDFTFADYRFPYFVYLPHDYGNDPSARYPVVYLLHGSGASLSEWDAYWPVIDKMIEDGRVRPFIAVAPITGNSYWVDSSKYGPVETAVVTGLLRDIEGRYQTVPGRNGRALLGISMGGYGALRYALVYPHLFVSVTLLSPALQEGMARPASGAVRRGSFGEPFDPDLWTKLNYPAALAAYQGQSRHRVHLYAIAGDDDWNHVLEPDRDDSLDDAVLCNMEMQTTLLYNKLRRTVQGERLRFRIVNGGHDAHVWAFGMEQGIAFMLEK